jgi:hypothetical protein
MECGVVEGRYTASWRSRNADLFHELYAVDTTESRRVISTAILGKKEKEKEKGQIRKTTDHTAMTFIPNLRDLILKMSSLTLVLSLHILHYSSNQLHAAVLREKLTVTQLAEKNSPSFMEPEGSSSCSQQHVSGPYPSHPFPLRSILMLSFHLHLGLPTKIRWNVQVTALLLHHWHILKATARR